MKLLNLRVIFILLSFGAVSCAQISKDKKDNKSNDIKSKYTNSLIKESSPYLLQHAHNPVNWHPWGKEALAKAKKENKMLLISIGYAACHWCHVMEHESFEDTLVAEIMNEHFVCIKVDREERPDVDHIYMTACQLVTKRGGWPLNAFALPDGRPFYAGTYFTKSDWTNALIYFKDLYRNDHATILKSAEQITEGIYQSGQVGLNLNPQNYALEQLNISFEQWKSSIDFENGGFDRAPKFPLPISWDFMLQYHHASGNKEALKALELTLDKIAFGGIYDHLGGGFARYSTDHIWKVPHFEKMLYDNGQLVSLYAQAYQLTKKPLYKKVVYETLEWIENEMTSVEGGFYSSLDADSEGEEGKFYIWKSEDIKEILGGDAQLFMDFYNCSESGNWEHKNNILIRQKTEHEFLKNNDLTVDEFQQKINTSKKKLLKERERRIRPGLDDKILTSWNALMLMGYLKAYRAFNEPKFIDAALKNANFLLNKTIQLEDYKISRNYKDGKAVISGFLDDYAFVISAFLELYQVTFDEQWLYHAKALTEHSIDNFFDSNSGMFHYTPKYNTSLIAPTIEITDNVIPSSNSEMANNLYKLGLYFNNKDFHNKATQMLANVANTIYQNPGYFANWGKLMLHLIKPPYEIAIVGDQHTHIRSEIDKKYLPDVLLMGGNTEGSLDLLEGKLVKNQTTIYVCQNKTCKRPVTNTKAAFELMN
ncbi:MAG: thioredoxin domain-containing protein [Saprospiraceae bacterium]|nr:thioredoxin domain-containing protein [Saprospiraceae bacterium]